MKRIHYILLLIVLLLVAAYFFFSKPSTTLKSEFSDFAIEDTSEVTKIYIADAQGENALLERQADDTWTVNGIYRVRKDAIDLLLKTFNLIRVREPVSKATFKTVVKELAVKSTKVEVYMGGTKPSKVYYVGHATKTHYGTNMLLEVNGEKSSMPYITHVPGFFGYLSTRFFTDQDLWRNRGIFEIQPEELASVEIKYLEKPLNSFKLAWSDKGFKLTDLSTNQEINNVNNQSAANYFELFKSVHYEYVDKDTPDQSVDSVQKSPALHTVTVQKRDGEKIELLTYYKPITDGTINQITGEPFTHNIDRLYGWINKTDFVIMQWPTLDKILAYKQDFMESENVEN